MLNYALFILLQPYTSTGSISCGVAMLLSSHTFTFYIMGFPNYLVLGCSEKKISVGDKILYLSTTQA